MQMRLSRCRQSNSSFRLLQPISLQLVLSFIRKPREHALFGDDGEHVRRLGTGHGHFLLQMLRLQRGALSHELDSSLLVRSRIHPIGVVENFQRFVAPFHFGSTRLRSRSRRSAASARGRDGGRCRRYSVPGFRCGRHGRSERYT